VLRDIALSDLKRAIADLVFLSVGRALDKIPFSQSGDVALRDTRGDLEPPRDLAHPERLVFLRQQQQDLQRPRRRLAPRAPPALFVPIIRTVFFNHGITYMATTGRCQEPRR